MTVTVTPSVENSTGPQDPPRVRLDVTDTGGLTSTTVTRLDPDGRTRPVRTLDGNPLTLSAGAGLLYDYEAPFGAPVIYSSLQSPATVSAQVTVSEPFIWLIHPGVSALSMPIELAADSFQEEEWPALQGVHQPMAREYPVVQTDGLRKAPGSSLTIAISSLADLANLRALLRDASTLLLNIPASIGYGVDTCYIAVGAVRNRRPSDVGADPHRSVVLPFQVVDRPAGGTQSERTYADVLANYASYTAVMSAYPTYLSLLAGP